MMRNNSKSAVLQICIELHSKWPLKVENILNGSAAAQMGWVGSAVLNPTPNELDLDSVSQVELS